MGLALAAALALSMPAVGQGKQLAQAKAALQAGEADKALALLEPLAQPGGEAEAYNLRCRVEYTLERWDKAANDCEQAVKLDGQSSDDHMWLARALGEKARRATFLNAYSLAKRVRTEFEEAVRLNPRNASALADLGEFYYSAPGVVGGGINKSEMVAAELDRIDPARAARMLESYLGGNARTEEAPAFVAHVWLAQLKKQLGDAAAGSRERAAALAMAQEYKPAQDLKY